MDNGAIPGCQGQTSPQEEDDTLTVCKGIKRWKHSKRSNGTPIFGNGFPDTALRTRTTLNASLSTGVTSQDYDSGNSTSRTTGRIPMFSTCTSAGDPLVVEPPAPYGNQWYHTGLIEPSFHRQGSFCTTQPYHDSTSPVQNGSLPHGLHFIEHESTNLIGMYSYVSTLVETPNVFFDATSQINPLIINRTDSGTVTAQGKGIGHISNTNSTIDSIPQGEIQTNYLVVDQVDGSIRYNDPPLPSNDIRWRPRMVNISIRERVTKTISHPSFVSLSDGAEDLVQVFDNWIVETF